MVHGRRVIDVPSMTGQVQDPSIVRVLLCDLRLSWVWLALRLALGWSWFDAGWRHLENPVWSAHRRGPVQFFAVAEILIGIALILGLLTGLAAMVGGILSVGTMVTGAAVMTPVPLSITVVLILAWKTAGWVGFDRWLLPVMGMPWDGGSLFRTRSTSRPRGGSQRLE